ncbi:hypothetical protein NP233_g9258 [Leucocoprinus birnbaumii]|uniref:DNA replication complex GINS protein PSF2 n=1 Tax=Leucocoprinus birnbaumii TaxID=56174 RepID=A0AAD5VKZ4_9AGAR|nr:hypothetical protein NP233_g9258 [Leucocoprinus birnbaumii]
MSLPTALRTSITPPELELIATQQLIEIVPLIAMERTVFISGVYGPLRPPNKAKVPLWIAINLKQKRKCHIVAPSWLTVEYLQERLALETSNPAFSELPFRYMEISKVLIDVASDDLENPDKLRSLLKDLREARQAKSREGLKQLDHSELSLPNLSAMEINELRPYFVESMTAVTSKVFEPLQDTGVQQQSSPNMLGGQIDYFAGYEDIFPPVPSIAERAKTRQRKPKAKPPQDILDLTDDDELMSKAPPSKPKKKPREKPMKEYPQAKQDSGSGSSSIPQMGGPTTVPVINAKNKIRPRPVKRTPLPPQTPQIDTTSQITLPIQTSPPQPLQNNLAGSPSRLDIPPSSVDLHRDAPLPPIEFLRTPGGTDTPFLSSNPGENVDELQTSGHHERRENHQGARLPPPPPTFFAGSSSLPPSAAPMAQLPPLLPNDTIDLTDIPSTTITPSIDVPVSNTTTKPKKPRKPRKKKGEAGDVEPGTTEAPKATSRKKKATELNQVFVEIPLPRHDTDELEEQPTTSKPRRKQVLYDSMEEDELNIRAGQLESVADVPVTVEQPSEFQLDNDQQVHDDTDNSNQYDPSEKSSKSNKRKDKKRKVAEDLDDDPPPAASSRKKKKAPRTAEAEDQGADEERVAAPVKRSSKKGKKGGENHDKDDNIQATRAAKVGKGKRRMVIASDDEDDSNGHPNPDDPPVQLPSPEDHQEEKGSPPSDYDDGAARAADHLQDDRSVHVLKVTDAQESSPNGDTVVAPSKRFETPAAGKYPSLASRYTIAPKTQTSGISELIRRANSHVNSPFATPAARGSPLARSVYSPMLKSSRKSLSRIAPLHPNRRTPPPPKPPPPPKRKSKKELEMEEKWEEEIIDEIGASEWLALSEAEKKEMKRMKRDRELGYCED